MKALTIKQPWASLIASGVKDVENRTWSTSYRGPLLIHAGAKLDRSEQAQAAMFRTPYSHWHLESLPRGGIIARAELVSIVRDSQSEWAIPGQYHWILRDVQTVKFTPCRGALQLWEHGDPPQTRLEI